MGIRLGVRRGNQALLVVLVALALAATVSSPVAAAPAPVPAPADDPFYLPPEGFESTEPGTVLRTRPVTVRGFGFPLPVSSWQTLARSTDSKGAPVAVVSTLMVPRTAYPGERPLVSYQTAIDSLGDQCNPSYGLQTGTEKEIGLLGQALARGWAVVVTDFEGPRNAYGAGIMAGHAVLDGIRAVQQVPSTGLAGVGTPVGLWGYSGGGQATTWAAELQPGYAPELDLVSVAAGGVPADLTAAGRQLDGGLFAGLFLGATVGVSREYPETTAVLNDAGRALVAEAGDMCVGDLVASYPFRRLDEFTTQPDALSDPRVAAVLAANKLGKVTPTAPIYLYHAVLDELIPIAGVETLRAGYCADGGQVLLHRDLASEHNILAVSGAPSAVTYLGARFAGVPAPSNC